MSRSKSLSKSAEAAALEAAAAAAAAAAAPPTPKPAPPSVLDELLETVINGRLESTTELLTRSNVNYADPTRNLTLLMWAVEANERAIVALLLNHGANQHLTDPAGYTALHRAAHRKNDELVKLLLSADASSRNVNAVSAKSKRTPLILGAMQGSVGVVAALLANGASVDCRDSSGMSAVDHAAFRGFESVVKLLSENGATCNSALYFAGDGAVHALTPEQKEQYEGLVRYLYSPWAAQSVVTP